VFFPGSRTKQISSIYCGTQGQQRVDLFPHGHACTTCKVLPTLQNSIELQSGIAIACNCRWPPISTVIHCIAAVGKQMAPCADRSASFGMPVLGFIFLLLLPLSSSVPVVPTASEESVVMLMYAARAAPQQFHDGLLTFPIRRHCLRSTPLQVDPGEGPLPRYSDYSNNPFPQWPVPTWNCLPDGGPLVKKQGEVLKSWNILPTVKSAVADNCERDIETARSLLSGLGLPDFNINVEESLFNPFPAVCT
jgi:hypothetical protein